MFKKPPAQRWTVQPPIGTPVDKSHRLYKDIRAVYMAGPGRMYDCFNYAKKPHTEQGNAVKDETNGGWKYNVDGTAEKLYMSPTGRKINDLCGPEGQTIYVWYDLDSLAGYGNLISHEYSNDDADADGWFLSHSDAAGSNYRFLYLRVNATDGYNAYKGTSNVVTAAQKDMQIVFRTDSNDLHTQPLDLFYRKGLGADIVRHPMPTVVYSAGTGPMTPPADSTAVRLGYRTSGAYLDGKYKLVIMWNGPLSEADARSILLNPWQIFEPMPLPMGEASSGTNVTTLSPVAKTITTNLATITGVTNVTTLSPVAKTVATHDATVLSATNVTTLAPVTKTVGTLTAKIAKSIITLTPVTKTVTTNLQAVTVTEEQSMSVSGFFSRMFS